MSGRTGQPLRPCGTGAGRRESGVSHRNTVVAGQERDAGRPPAVPDLTELDLRTLRTMDDPALTEAVRGVLDRPWELAEAWWSESDPT
ncbi:FxSxx-COOH cyclophane-containing RiPP peptide [Streptomyces flavidovirens]|uniref:FxSxx-COOH cyclophane-containing RiPP peptide n=1 Tax=Streptomyces flavidovirens TaxID=67298 RepID=A0ABW6RB18_9ACTN